MYKTVDLFAGIGGIRRGFELTQRFENVLSAEIDKYACQTYLHLFGEDPCNDVASEEFKNKVRALEYDTLLAGFPCQSFSRAGKEEGFADVTRGTLFFDIADIIQTTRPKSFLLENVDNLLSHDRGNTIKVILETLVLELDYKVIGVEKDDDGNLIYDKQSLMRNSRNFGVPQNRPRVYLMGFDRRAYGNKVDNLPSDKLPEKRIREPIAEELKQLLDFGASKEFYIAQGYLDTLKKHKARHKGKGNGFGYMVINQPGLEKQYSNALLATGGSGKERNLVYDPQDGIAGEVVKGKQTPLNNEHIRHMTPTEWGKLQGFIGYAFVDENGVDKFSFPPKISNTQLYKQFGNSVTIPVIEEMAMFMCNCLDYLEDR
ncbi:DNA (cytosine-5-)-methyltransferase [Bacillus cereus]|nr:DNA (cytosine-5-)-methyltransferase [Bacillus cereus]